MASRTGSQVKRRRAHRNGRRPRNHSTPSGHQAEKADTEPIGRGDRHEEGHVLERLSQAIALVETIALAMRTREEDRVLGSVMSSLDLACRQLRGAYSAIDLALNRIGA